MDMTTVNCETGEITVTPLNDGQLAALAEAETRDQNERAERQAKAEQDERDRALIAAGGKPGARITNDHLAAIARQLSGRF